jgi:hypothetical protein
MREYTSKLRECSSYAPLKAAPNEVKVSPGQPRRLSVSSPLRTTAPELFAELVYRYGALLDEAVEQRTHQGESISPELGDLSACLERLQADARDVIELHARALKEKLTSAPPRLTEVYMEEGRFVVLELMGRLLSDYRKAFLQATQLSS